MTTETIIAFLQKYNGVMLLVTAVAIIAMEWAGRKGSLLLIYYAFGRKAAINYDTRWTAVGVIFHELSHLLFAFLTGAKIEGFRLYRFKRSEDDDVLGYVNYAPRGFFLMRTVQNTLTGIAPALLGSANVCLLGSYTRMAEQRYDGFQRADHLCVGILYEPDSISRLSEQH